MTAPVDPPPDAFEARLRALSTHTSAVLWHTAPDGSAVEVNPSWSAFTGQSPEQSAGWGWLAAIHPEDVSYVVASWRDGVARRALVEMQYRLRRRDGVWRDMEAQGVPVLADGEVREWVGVCIDVTDRKAARETLQASEERLRFLDRLSEATRSENEATRIMAVSAELLGRHLDAQRCAYADVEADNDRFTIRSDWSAEGVATSAGVYSLDLFGPQATSNLRRGRKLVVNDVDRELGDDGGGRMFNAIGIKAIICAPLVKDDRLVAMMAVHETTPRRWSDGDIALVGEVVERCWAHIERVRDAALLREQDRHKDEFLATLAHELRNPLAPMRFALAIMQRTQDPAKVADARAVVERQVTHMARLVDDLLDQSRINRGMIELRRERIGVAALMRQAVEASRPEIEAARHSLDVRLAPADLELDADPARIVQMIGNLLNNAAKYTPDGGRIVLAARPVGARVEIEVADNGIGIPLDQQARVFEMFSQLEHSASRAKGGLGIGLSLVKRLADMHGGAVRVRSAGPGTGTAFTIELPLAGAPEGRDGVPADTGGERLEQALPHGPSDAGSAPAASVERAPAPRGRVLVVEDNPDGLRSLLSLLEAFGYAAEAAADGPAALAAARAFAPDIVLLDLGLPGMDGCDVARALRAEGAAPGAVLVALTGWGAERDRERTRNAGFDHHLTKPVDPAALQTFLKRIRAEQAVPRA
ncbi:ATP-binding protein [Piscinibacter koreensis]|uniref:histidine kinase n=1 Tax=Piscinibacter koreensis TaxID=2742824 RepID=A0A7Y6NRF6_9BURK|nr:response regulator [Schlegelella koreensis]